MGSATYHAVKAYWIKKDRKNGLKEGSPWKERAEEQAFAKAT